MSLDIPSEDEHPQRRVQAGEVLEERECRFSRSLNTTLAPDTNETDVFYGSMFKINPRTVSFSIVTLELDLEADTEDSAPVQVYYRIGGFGAFYNQPDDWTLAVDTVAQLAPEQRTYIIPTEEFTAIDVSPQDTVSIYVAMQSESLKLSDTGDLKWNDLQAEDDTLRTYVGYGFDSTTLFPDDFLADRQFHGLVHYELKAACDSAISSMVMELPFIIDRPDTPPLVLGLVSSSVDQAVKHGMGISVNLVAMQSFHALRKTGVLSERDESFNEPCPFGWQNCARVIAYVSFEHSFTITPGMIEFEVLRYATKAEEPQAFGMGYVGDMPLALDFFVTLADVPKNIEMDSVQKEYFAEQTLSFLNDHATHGILHVRILGQKLQSDLRRLESSDNYARRLQTIKTEMHISIMGRYEAWPAPLHPNSTRGVNSLETVEMLQGSFDDNSEDYLRYLKQGVLRPGPASELGRPDFFTSMSGAEARFDEDSLFMPTPAPTDMPSFAPTTEYVPKAMGIPTSVWRVLGLVLLILGCCLLLYTVYWEWEQRKADKRKLKRAARAAQRKVDQLRAEKFRRAAAAKKAGGDGKLKPQIV